MAGVRATSAAHERAQSQLETNQACGWSGAHLSYIENAQQNVTLDDLEHLLALYEVEVQVLPLAAGVHSAAFGAFVILGFPWESDPGLVYVENRSGAVYLESSHEIDAHSLVCQQLSVLALNAKESINLLRNVVKGGQS